MNAHRLDRRDDLTWAHCEMAISLDVRRVYVGARSILFSERSQRLFDLNETADFIWTKVREGETCASIATSLQDAGATPTEAMDFASAALSEWLTAGHVTPVEVMRDLRASPRFSTRLGVGACNEEIRFFGDADPAMLGAILAGEPTGLCPPSSQLGPSRRIEIVGRFGRHFVFSDGAPLGMVAPTQSPPKLKALLTQSFCNGVDGGFLAHGALVSSKGCRVFLTGAPGAGKTTLALALTGRGFAFASDDIVPIDAHGRATGSPFAAAAKAGSWEMLAPYLPGLGSLPVYERSDGRRTRYVKPALLDTMGPRPIDLVLVLDRNQGRSCCVEPLSSLDALSALIESGYAHAGRLDAATLQALAENLREGACHRLVYHELDSAIATVAGLM